MGAFLHQPLPVAEGAIGPTHSMLMAPASQVSWLLSLEQRKAWVGRTEAVKGRRTLASPVPWLSS